MKNPELAKQEDERKVQRGKIIRKKVPRITATAMESGPMSSEEKVVTQKQD